MQRGKAKCAAALCAWALCAGCVVGVRSNMSFVNTSVKATNDGRVTSDSKWGGSPAVNADKQYSDMLNNSGNGAGLTPPKPATPPKPE